MEKTQAPACVPAKAGWQIASLELNSSRIIILKMKSRLIQSFAALLLLAAIATWLGAGANRGWTKTTVPVKTVDEITGIEAISYQKRFVPGLDFLGAAAAGAALLFGISWFFKTREEVQ